MLKMIFRVLGALFFSALPAVLSCLASSDHAFKWLVDNKILGDGFSIEIAREFCLWGGAIPASLLLAYQLFTAKTNAKRALKERDLVIKMNKDMFGRALGQAFNGSQVDFNIRIFIPKYPRLYAFLEFMASHTKRTNNFWKTRKRVVVIKNIDLIAEQGSTKGLSLGVSPVPQGLVGLCYAGKAFLWDDNLIETNDKIYNLTEGQIMQTKDARWVIGCPIFNDKNDVVAILSLDGKTPVKMPKNKKGQNDVQECIISFSRMLYDAVPQLFRR